MIKGTIRYDERTKYIGISSTTLVGIHDIVPIREIVEEGNTLKIDTFEGRYELTAENTNAKKAAIDILKKALEAHEQFKEMLRGKIEKKLEELGYNDDLIEEVIIEVKTYNSNEIDQQIIEGIQDWYK